MRAAIILAALTVGAVSALESSSAAGVVSDITLVQREADPLAEAEPIIPLLIKGAKMGIKAGVKGAKHANRVNNAKKQHNNRKNRRDALAEADPEADPEAEPIIPLLIKGAKMGIKAGVKGAKHANRVNNAKKQHNNRKNKREAEAFPEAEADPEAEPIIPLLIKGAKMGIKAGVKGAKHANRVNNAKKQHNNRKNRRDALAEADPKRTTSPSSSLATLHANFRNKNRPTGVRARPRRASVARRASGRRPTRRPSGGSGGNVLHKIKDLGERLRNPIIKKGKREAEHEFGVVDMEEMF